MKINFYYIVFLLVIMLTSCDYLDVPFDNRAQVDSEEKVGMLLVSAYTTATEWVIAEFSSDNVDHMIGLGFNELSAVQGEAYRWEQITGDVNSQDTPDFVWNRAFRAIANANLALESIERLERETGLTPGLRAFRAEAMMARAYHHFLMASIFCMPFGSNAANELGLPYITQLETTVAPIFERGTLLELFENINRDIVAALPHITDEFLVTNTRQYRFNRRAAHAFAARFNKHFHQWEEVVRHADFVLGNNPASVLRDWEHGGRLSFTGSNDPARGNWFVYRNEANLLNTVAASLHWRFMVAARSGTQYAHNVWISRTETVESVTPWGGGQGGMFFSEFAWTVPPKVFVPKFEEYFQFLDPIQGVGLPNIIQVHFTTDETLLTRAEAHIMLGNYDDAVADMNMFMLNFMRGATPRTKQQIINFYNSRNYYRPDHPTPKHELRNPDLGIVSGSEKANLLHAVLHMRRMLTLHEGLRWQDIRRHGIEITRRDVEDGVLVGTGDVLRFDDPRRAIQIPESVAAAGVEKNRR